MTEPAKVVTEQGISTWRCPNCDQKLGNILGVRVVIRVSDRLISLPATVEPDQVCWRCGTTSVLKRE